MVLPRRRRLVALALAAAVGLVVSFSLAGCGGMSLSDFEDRTPVLSLDEYFDGPVQAWGVFTGRFNGVTRRFVVDIEPSRENGELVLDERFRYDDGETDRRIWRIRETAPGRYEGRADDVIGTATGEAAGSALRWRYTLALEAGGRTWHVNFDDWMILMDEDVMMNRARVSKLGITVGEVVLFFRKVPPP